MFPNNITQSTRIFIRIQKYAAFNRVKFTTVIQPSIAKLTEKQDKIQPIIRKKINQ